MGVIQMAKRITTALIILDGWGWSEEKNGNAILEANTPNWDKLIQACPVTQLSASGPDVGLPDGQMGNSEVGHLTMGAGRVRHQDLTRINEAIENRDFNNNKVILDALQKTKINNSALHVMGLLSDGGVHSHQKHIFALLQLAQEFSINKIYLHAFLDGRDTKPKCAKESLDLFQTQFDKSNVQIATISGRFYAMDRDNRWDRIEIAFNALNNICELRAANPIIAIENAYSRNETDEFVKPTIVNDDFKGLQKDDAIIFMNFRADRARQMCEALTSTGFNKFMRKNWIKIHNFTTLTKYDSNISANIAFKPEILNNVLGKILANKNLSQLRLAETEKYAHVTYFFNGGDDEPFKGEIRKLIKSPSVKTYDQKPQMSAKEITDFFVTALKENKYDVIICNFANADMVGHTGNFSATIKAIEVLDACLGKITNALEETGCQALITADHGNADCMFQGNTKNPHTAHTTNLVPLIYVGNKKLKFISKPGTLSDVSPTLLSIMNIDKPKEMTGQSLLELSDKLINN
jgi:2,3-bisphosphoglycerate-independent phosphoglycerate mutase